MQIVSDSVKRLVNTFAPVTLAIYIDGEKLNVGIGTGSYTGACAGDDEFSFGNACAAGMNIEIAASRPLLKGHRIQITWSVNGAEYPLLTGCVETSKVTAGHTAIEAWDDMYFAGSNGFEVTDAVAGDCDAAAAFAAVAASMGVAAEQESLALLADLTIPGGLSNIGELSNSAVAGHIAGLVGGNALITRAGLLAIRQYTGTGWETEPYSGGASAENDDFSVTGVTLQREKTASKTNADGTAAEQAETIEYSAGDGSLMLSNPLASQDAADRAFEALENLVIRPGNFSFPGGLLLEPGDIFTVRSMDGSYAVAVGSVTMDFDGGVKSSVTCGGTAEAGGAVGAINQAVQALIRDFAKFKKLYADNAEISSANIKYLIVNMLCADTVKLTQAGSDGYVFWNEEEFTAFVESAAKGMEANTQKSFSVSLAFDPFIGIGTLTISVCLFDDSKVVLASVFTGFDHWFGFFDSIDEEDTGWGGWRYVGIPRLSLYVVREYTNGDWWVREWSNGECEMWYTYTGTADIATAFGSVYYGNNVIPAIDYPPSIHFTRAPTVIATPQSQGLTAYGLFTGEVPGTTTATPSFCVWRANARYSVPVCVDLYVKGTLAK